LNAEGRAKGANADFINRHIFPGGHADIARRYAAY
jgi:hypothetical protein